MNNKLNEKDYKNKYIDDDFKLLFEELRKAYGRINTEEDEEKICAIACLEYIYLQQKQVCENTQQIATALQEAIEKNQQLQELAERAFQAVEDACEEKELDELASFERKEGSLLH